MVWFIGLHYHYQQHYDTTLSITFLYSMGILTLVPIILVSNKPNCCLCCCYVLLHFLVLSIFSMLEMFLPTILVKFKAVILLLSIARLERKFLFKTKDKQCSMHEQSSLSLLSAGCFPLLLWIYLFVSWIHGVMKQKN